MTVLPVAAEQVEVPLEGRPEARSAWEWRSERRIAERLDPVMIRERNGAEAARSNGGRTPAATAQTVTEINDPGTIEYFIDGRRNPELFLPHELFDALMSGLGPDPDLSMKQRGFYRHSIRTLGFDDARLWEGLESVSGTYLVLNRGNAGTLAGTQQEVRDAETARCRARHEAMEAARSLFGRDRFDKLLYTVIAPSMISATAVSNLEEHQRSLAEAARGCR